MCCLGWLLYSYRRLQVGRKSSEIFISEPETPNLLKIARTAVSVVEPTLRSAFELDTIVVAMQRFREMYTVCSGHPVTLQRSVKIRRHFIFGPIKWRIYSTDTILEGGCGTAACILTSTSSPSPTVVLVDV